MKNRDDDNYHDVDFDLNENAENNKCTIKTAIGFTIVTTIVIELDAMRHYKILVNIWMYIMGSCPFILYIVKRIRLNNYMLLWDSILQASCKYNHGVASSVKMSRQYDKCDYSCGMKPHAPNWKSAYPGVIIINVVDGILWAIILSTVSDIPPLHGSRGFHC